ncbi:MAG: 1,4-dihydroxy-2-naphthoate octaprenyltransferase [Flavobacteriales bacterium]|nr:1,4-dihydroxy-2-naphthoate octaprenyltransferase [Flavobacteriales bacterium]
MKIKHWIKAFRLRTLPLSVSCILMGFALSSIESTVDYTLLYLTITTTVFLQILSNLANDYGDGVKGADKSRKGEQRMVASGLISKNNMFSAVIIFSVLSLFSGLTLIYFSFEFSNLFYPSIFLILGLFSIWGAIKYTMGKTPYGYIGFGDVFVFVFFGILGVIGSYFLFCGQINSIVFAGAFFCGCLSVSVLNMNNMRDYHSDKLAGKNTVVVNKGLSWAKYYHVSLILSAIIALSIIYIHILNHWLLLALIPVLVLLLNIIKVLTFKNNIELDAELKKIALSTFVITLIITLCLV